jgi:hemerythrin
MLIEKEDIPQVAMDFMNDVHDEDVDIINAIYDLILKYENDSSEENEIALSSKYQAWFEHTINHFKGEEDKMLELNFPPYPMHKGEHEHALARMDEIYRSWNSSKDINILKNYISKELPEWFFQHVQTMDTVTAMFFQTGMSPCSMH